jgi:hypothetical protein
LVRSAPRPVLQHHDPDNLGAEPAAPAPSPSSSREGCRRAHHPIIVDRF